MNIELASVSTPEIHRQAHSVTLTDATLAERKSKLLGRMQQHCLDAVIIYADREHGANFEYFTGFIPRFEEACLVVRAGGESSLLLGNENLKMARHARIAADAVHVPFFSLPNQPMAGERPFADYFRDAGLSPDSRIGVIGWKLFTAKTLKNAALFDLPSFVVDALRDFVGEQGSLVNATSLLISPEEGIRTLNNANEIAHYEYGATLAGAAIFDALQAIEVGKREREVGALLAREGQPNSVTTICATGDRFTDATLYPRDKTIALQDKFALTVGYKGGLSSRSGFVIERADQLPDDQKDYLERVAKPYFRAYLTWLETLEIGLSGQAMYTAIEAVLPRADYGWTLNPGHYTADEEWLASPFFPGSTAVVQSGQLFQIDIIPSVKGYAGASCEEPVAIADETLRLQISSLYPDLWQRIQRRRAWLKELINVDLREDVLPLSDTVAFLTPFLLSKRQALVKR